MAARSALLIDKTKTLRDNVSAATLATIPAAPAEGAHTGWADLDTWRSGAHALRAGKFSFRGSTTATLNSAFFVGWNSDKSVAEVFAKVNDGGQVDLVGGGTPPRAFGQVLYDVPACYRFVTVIGTLSAGNITIDAAPLEVSE